MRVGVGYSENPDTVRAGRQAADEALKDIGSPCDLALLFATVRHEPRLLRAAAASALGPEVPIFGGGTVGAITNENFGYAGAQVILAAVWLEDARCEILTQGGLDKGEEEAGLKLGRELAAAGAHAASPVLIFYDAINRSQGDLRLLMATPLLKGLEEGLGFRPDLVGAGLMSDYACSPTWQWTGDGLAQHSAMALAFSGNIRLHSTVMHGCHPATCYYKVTKADRQVILEINNQPALTFLSQVLGDFIRPEDYPFFLILGINSGDKWAPFDEKNYANRLCLGLDPERNGLVMFEPDMVEGTEFQVMYRGLDLDYMLPKVAGLFDSLGGRRPVFATYINCAGRAAGHAGLGIEDAVIIQREIAGRVPLLGLYTGVEIGPVRGRPQSLDWTGVLTLFSEDPSG
jgi:small ligand-binding sensory domain FIST